MTREIIPQSTQSGISPVTHPATLAVSVQPGLSVPCGPAPNAFNRTEACQVQLAHFTVYSQEGVPVGVTFAYLYQYMRLNPRSKSWTEHDTVTRVFGTAQDITVTLVATCANPCHATAHLAGSLKAGLTGTVDYTDNVKDGHFDAKHTSYTLFYTSSSPGPVLSYPQWNLTLGNGPLDFRCDNGLATKGTGCVFAKYVPTLSLSLKKYGASADMIRWAQQHMSAHWGLRGHGAGLTREPNSETADKNRMKVCDSTFQNLGTAIGSAGDMDSCDEFPFAKSKQSGASKLGKPPFPNGLSCAQLKAVLSNKKGATEAEQWNTVAVTGSPNLGAPCVRGHIPGKLNSAVGGAYGSFVQNQRIITDPPYYSDRFWVAVTS